MILFVLGFVMLFVVFIVHDEDNALPTLTCIMIAILCFGLVIGVNKSEEAHYISTIELYSTFNTTEMNVHGGLFYTSTENKDYLIYWTDEGSFKKRSKTSINWNLTEVYENDAETPRIEKYYIGYKNVSSWFDMGKAKSLNKIKLYVPEGTIIQYMELK